MVKCNLVFQYLHWKKLLTIRFYTQKHPAVVAYQDFQELLMMIGTVFNVKLFNNISTADETTAFKVTFFISFQNNILHNIGSLFCNSERVKPVTVGLGMTLYALLFSVQRHMMY